jgi:hypothetical protein
MTIRLVRLCLLLVPAVLALAACHRSPDAAATATTSPATNSPTSLATANTGLVSATPSSLTACTPGTAATRRRISAAAIQVIVDIYVDEGASAKLFTGRVAPTRQAPDRSMGSSRYRLHPQGQG